MLKHATHSIAACAMLAWASAAFCQSTDAPDSQPTSQQPTISATLGKWSTLRPSAIGLHLASLHSRSGFNNANPGVYLRWADSSGTGWVAGTYHNSERAQSVYAAYAWSTRLGSTPFSAAITAGAVTGYAAHRVTPLLVPSAAWHAGSTAARLTYVPKFEKRGAHALHLSIERSF